MKKSNLYLYLIIFIFTILTCSPLLQMHLSSDTYNFIDEGYFDYADIFLQNGRVISAFMTYLGGVLNLNYEVFIIGMQILSVIIASFSIYILYKTIVEKVMGNEEEAYKINIKNVLFLMSANLIIFNCMALEYFLYAENAVMCLGLFLCILSAKILTSKQKHNYIKAAILLTISIFCYQGYISIFITLVVLFNIIDKQEYKTKKLIKQFFIAGILTVVSYLFNILEIYLANNLMGEIQERAGGLESILQNIINVIPISQGIFKYTLLTNFNLWPNFISIIWIAITTIIVTCTQDKVSKTIKYIFLVMIAIIATMLPVFVMQNPSIEARTSMSIGSIIGISCIYLVSLDLDRYKKTQKIATIIIIAFFIFNTINTIQIFTAHIVTNKIDSNMGHAIKQKIEEYEKDTGKSITKVAVQRDKNNRAFPYGYNKKLFSFTQRAFDNYRCIVEALNYYCNRKFQVVPMDMVIYETNFQGKNWDAYSDEQIVFENDIMYLCTY